MSGSSCTSILKLCIRTTKARYLVLAFAQAKLSIRCSPENVIITTGSSVVVNYKQLNPVN